MFCLRSLSVEKCLQLGAINDKMLNNLAWEKNALFKIHEMFGMAWSTTLLRNMSFNDFLSENFPVSESGRRRKQPKPKSDLTMRSGE